MQFDIHEFDGSSDLLVTTALAEVRQRSLISPFFHVFSCVFHGFEWFFKGFQGFSHVS